MAHTSSPNLPTDEQPALPALNFEGAFDSTRNILDQHQDEKTAQQIVRAYSGERKATHREDAASHTTARTSALDNLDPTAFDVAGSLLNNPVSDPAGAASYPTLEQSRPSNNYAGVCSSFQERGLADDPAGEPHHHHLPTAQLASVRGEFHPGKECQSRRDFVTPRLTWLNGTMIFICGLSTALSAIFVLLAAKSQRYGEGIGTGPKAKLDISTAILLTSVLAKTVELSFVTGFVAFLGQVLSRKALAKNQGSGATLAEMTMWRWVVQPGTLITQSEIARFSGLSFLGILTLLSTILSTLYGTAAIALVQPILKESEWHDRTLAGIVYTDFANMLRVQKMCMTPIRTDPEYVGSTCTQMQHAGRSLYNQAEFLADWNAITQTPNVTSDQSKRPARIALPYANATLVPQWIGNINTTELSRKFQRVINNVSLALPHVGVVNSVHEQRNSMPLSTDSNSVQPFLVWASVPSPVMNVLCVHMNKTELSPIVYDSWNNETVNSTTWTPAEQMSLATTTNNTVVDDIFGWTKKDQVTMLDYPPVFSRYPKDYNTIVNNTSYAWGRPAIYMLGQGGLGTGLNQTGEYPLCRFQVNIMPECSTLFSASAVGSTAEARCEGRAEDMAYLQTMKNATRRVGLANWRDVGFDWSISVSLGTGILDGEGSVSRALMHLMLKSGNLDPEHPDVNLDPLLPSLAETLAILASDTLVLSWQDAPFTMFWNYTKPQLESPQTQYFRSKIKFQEYSSGGVDTASKGWLVILISTFLVNVLMLIYFLLQSGLVTDFSQPAQLFALAINSPPARILAGSCGAGPEGQQYKAKWVIHQEDGHLYMEPQPNRHSVLLANEDHTSYRGRIDDLDHAAAPGDISIEARKSSGFLSPVSAVLGQVNLNFRSITRTRSKTSQASGTEPLRRQDSSNSKPSLYSEHELVEIEDRRQSQRTRSISSTSIS